MDNNVYSFQVYLEEQYDSFIYMSIFKYTIPFAII